MFKFNVRNNAYKLFVTFCVLSVIFLFFFTKKSKISIYSAKSYLEVFSSDYVEYKKNCIDLFKKKRNINSDLIFRPPLKKPPEELMDDFEQNGDMPITNYRYFNDAYLDSDSLNTKQSNEVITQQTLDDLVNKISKNESFNYYADEALKDLFLSSRYKANILDKTMAVFGTILIWVEAIAYKAGSSKIFTFDYTRKTYFDQNKFHWYHMLDYLDEAINGGFIENFDNAVSFSSFEHSGLGRYGDPLEPYGDYEAVQQCHCMLKPGGILFLGLPTSGDGSSYIEYNAHRVYGTKRLNLLFKGWKLLETRPSPFHSVFVLEKQTL